MDDSVDLPMIKFISDFVDDVVEVADYFNVSRTLLLHVLAAEFLTFSLKEKE